MEHSRLGILILGSLSNMHLEVSISHSNEPYLDGWLGVTRGNFETKGIVFLAYKCMVLLVLLTTYANLCNGTVTFMSMFATYMAWIQ